MAANESAIPHYGLGQGNESRRPHDGLNRRGGLIARLLVLQGRNRIRNETSTRLHRGYSVLQGSRANSDR